MRPHESTLIRRLATCAGVDRRTARKQRMGPRRPAVVLQVRVDLRVAGEVLDVRGQARALVDEVVAERRERRRHPVAVRAAELVSDDRVLRINRDAGHLSPLLPGGQTAPVVDH